MSNNLADEILKAMKTYTDEVGIGVEKEVDKTARNMAKELRESGPKRTGDYRAGWTHKKDKENDKSYSRVVFNKDKYQLTHLLEKGHINRDGTTRTKAIPHIQPVEEKYASEFENNIVKVIEGLNKWTYKN